MHTITDHPDFLPEYRKQIGKAMDVFVSELKKIETVSLGNLDDVHEIQNEYKEVLKKTMRLIDTLNVYDNLLYEFQQKISKYIASPIRL